MQQHSNALPPGHHLEEYRIDAILGAGGFGITYKAWDTHLDTWVAIKEFFPVEWAYRDHDLTSVLPNVHSRRADKQEQETDYAWGLERFLDEARVLARIRHPNVVRIQRYFRAHGTAYIVMEYEDGEPLNALLAHRDTLPEVEIVSLLNDLLPALAAVHSHGFLHRDIKPGNIYLRSRDDAAMLIDFGAARQALGRVSRSVTGLVTPGYSPPEQYALRGDRYGTWTDIYALGAVLYRCVSGAPPLEAAERLLDDNLTPARTVGSGRYSEALLDVIDHCLAIRPQDRYQTVVEIQTRLGMTTTPVVTHTVETTATRPAADMLLLDAETALVSTIPARRWPWVGAVLLACALGGTVLGFWFRYSLAPPLLADRTEPPVAPVASVASVAPVVAVPVAPLVVPTEPTEPVAPAVVPIAPVAVAAEPLVPVAPTTPTAAPTAAPPATASVAAPIEPLPPAIDPAIDEEPADAELVGTVANVVPAVENGVTTAEDVPTETPESATPIDKLLRQARDSLKADRLTTPYQQSALFYVEQVLELDAKNGEARRIRNQIVERYIILARRDMEQAEYDKAWRSVNRGLVIDSRHPDLLALENQLRRTRTQPQAPRVVPSNATSSPFDTQRSFSNPDTR